VTKREKRACKRGEEQPGRELHAPYATGRKIGSISAANRPDRG
jgi:hypothetical protein